MVSVGQFHGDVDNVDFTSGFKICWSDQDIEDIVMPQYVLVRQYIQNYLPV